MNRRFKMPKNDLKDFLRQIFCLHRDSEVVCWHWTHGIADNDIRFLEIQMRCKRCGKYYFTYIYDWNEAEDFAFDHRDKRWSLKYKPVL